MLVVVVTPGGLTDRLRDACVALCAEHGIVFALNPPPDALAPRMLVAGVLTVSAVVAAEAKWGTAANLLLDAIDCGPHPNEKLLRAHVAAMENYGSYRPDTAVRPTPTVAAAMELLRDSFVK